MGGCWRDDITPFCGEGEGGGRNLKSDSIHFAHSHSSAGTLLGAGVRMGGGWSCWIGYGWGGRGWRMGTRSLVREKEKSACKFWCVVAPMLGGGEGVYEDQKKGGVWAS